jgi:hypothetical protein
MQNINLRSTIFLDNDSTINFMRLNGWITEEIDCDACHSCMKIVNYARAANGKAYRCQNRECRRRKSLLSGTRMSSPKIRLKDYLTAVYCFIMNMHNYQAIDIADIDEATYITIKKIIYPMLEFDLELNHELLGTPTNPVQVDETAICRGRIIENPSSTYDDTPNVTWLVGIIEEGTNRLVMKIVPNRSSEVMKELFRRHINQGTVIKTDGHKSYPSAVEEINGIHVIVNHSQGFINEEGHHTNLIENTWSHLKTEIQARRGISRSNMMNFIVEFVWRKVYLKKKSRRYFNEAFHRILSYINQ